MASQLSLIGALLSPEICLIRALTSTAAAQPIWLNPSRKTDGMALQEDQHPVPSQSVLELATLENTFEFVVTDYKSRLDHLAGQPMSSQTFHMAGHDWIILLYPDGKRSISDSKSQTCSGEQTGPGPQPDVHAYAEIYVAHVGQGDEHAEGVVHTEEGPVHRAFHHFTLVDQLGNTEDIAVGRRREDGLQPVILNLSPPVDKPFNWYGHRRFVRREILDNPDNGFIKDDKVLIKYQQQVVVCRGLGMQLMSTASFSRSKKLPSHAALTRNKFWNALEQILECTANCRGRRVATACRKMPN